MPLGAALEGWQQLCRWNDTDSAESIGHVQTASETEKTHALAADHPSQRRYVSQENKRPLVHVHVHIRRRCHTGPDELSLRPATQSVSHTLAGQPMGTR